MLGKEIWANPTPALLFGLAAGLTPLGLLIAGVIPAEAGPVVAPYLIAVAISNLLCSLMLLRNGDLVWGNLGLFFGTMLVTAGAVSSLLRTVWTLRGMEAQIAPQFEGWAYLSCGIVLLLFLPVLARVTWPTFLASLVMALGLVSQGIGYIGGLDTQLMVNLSKLGGWATTAFGVYLFYAGFAVLTNIVYQRGVIPLGAPLVKSGPEEAVPADAVAQEA